MYAAPVIGRLHGVVIERDPGDGCCVLDVGGVGYEVFVPLRCMASLPSAPSSVTLHVHTHVREEALTLFGFVAASERVTFRALTSVSGVGPKLAMAILGDMTTEQLGAAVHAGDKKRLGAVSGVGKKLAARLVLELKEKVSPASPVAQGSVTEESGPHPVPGSAAERACDALVQMGFGRADAERAVSGLGESVDGAAVEDVLRRALKVLS